MRFKLIILVVGSVLIYLGYEETRLGAVAKAKAKAIPTSELMANGVGDNAHVEISDFWICDLAFVYQERKRSRSWSTIWAPVLSLDDPYFQGVLETLEKEESLPEGYPMPTDIRLIVKSG